MSLVDYHIILQGEEEGVLLLEIIVQYLVLS